MCLKVNKIRVECFSKKKKKTATLNYLLIQIFWQIFILFYTRCLCGSSRDLLSLVLKDNQPQPNMKTFSIFVIVRIFFTFSFLFAWKPNAFLFNFHFTKVLNQSPSLRLIFVIKFVLCFHLLHSNPLHYYK